MRIASLVSLGFPTLALAAMASSCGLLSGAECASDDDCHGSKVCAEGACVECKSDAECGARESCVQNSCERGGGEGEGEGGEGEGEGAVGEGEGGEGEGGAGEGEGEGGVAGADTLRARITWDSTTADLDIHLTQKDGTGQFCVSDMQGATGAGPQSTLCTAAPLDCNFGDCKNGFGPSPDWDGTASPSAGDPTLDIDDVSGLGPEQISVQALPAGDYLLGAFFYSTGTGASPLLTSVTAELFVGLSGAPAFTKSASLDDVTNRWVDFAIIHKSGANVCVEDLTDGDPTDDCP